MVSAEAKFQEDQGARKAQGKVAAARSRGHGAGGGERQF